MIVKRLLRLIRDDPSSPKIYTTFLASFFISSCVWGLIWFTVQYQIFLWIYGLLNRTHSNTTEIYTLVAIIIVTGVVLAYFLINSPIYLLNRLSDAIFLLLAHQGFSFAQCNVGLRHLKERSTLCASGDPDAAIYWLRKAALGGDAGAQRRLGSAYQYTLGVRSDHQQMVYWYRKAASQRSPTAQTLLGHCYYWGVGVDQDRREAFRHFKLAADQGDPEGERLVGAAYLLGEGVDRHWEESYGWFRKSAKKGNAFACGMVAALYDDGYIVDKDERAAASWYRKAASKGNARAQYRLGILYEQGLGVPRNLEKSREWLLKSSRQGYRAETPTIGDVSPQSTDLSTPSPSADPSSTRQNESLQIDGRIDEARLRSALAKLDGMVGLSAIKTEVRTLANDARMREQRREAGAMLPAMALHLAFRGNPGAGQTAVACLMGEIYAALGLLRTGHVVETDHQGLVGQDLAQTAIRTRNRVAEALDGVLFIRHASSLVRPDLETEGFAALSTLLTEIGVHRGRIALILEDGDPAMHRLLSLDVGVRSTVARCMKFMDYGPDELSHIFQCICRDADCDLAEGTLERASHAIDWRVSRDPAFGNARGVRAIFEQALERRATRVMRGPSSETSILLPIDVPEADGARGLDRLPRWQD